jgi:two-component system, OmpR family, sensor histidine kinase TctE
MSSSATPHKSLRGQLLALLVVPLLALLVVNSVLTYRVAIDTANEAYDRLLLASVRAIADRVTISKGEIVVDLPYVALELFESNIKERIFYKVASVDGAAITGYDDLPLPPPDAPRDRPGFFHGEYHGESLYQAALYKRLYDPTINAEVLIQVGETAESRDALSRRILYDGLVRQTLLILLAAVLVWRGVQYMLRPLARLREEIAGRSATDVTPVGDAGMQSEVRPLIQALNQHAARIETMTTARLKFITDAAHQVRTRFSILRTQVEYGQRLEDLEAMRGVLAGAQANVEETSRFFTQLMVLAHAEASLAPPREQAGVDVAALAHSLALEWVGEARAKQINLGFEGPEAGAVVRGQSILLRELVTNLLDNAIRYTHAGGSVTLRIAVGEESVVLEVEDNGPGIAATDRGRAFERFYRGTEGEGSGLGLAIASEICRAHDASIELASPAGGDGLLVRVRMRRERATAAVSESRSPPSNGA